MTRVFACIALTALVSGIAPGQTPDAAPRFQIADVHVSPHSANPDMRADVYIAATPATSTRDAVRMMRVIDHIDPKPSDK